MTSSITPSSPFAAATASSAASSSGSSSPAAPAFSSSGAPSRRRRSWPVVAGATAVVVGLLSAAACSSPTAQGPPAAGDVSVVAAPQASNGSGSDRTSEAARQALLRDVLDRHRAAGEFVGARIALRDPDGTITQAESGTTTIDPASGPVDPDLAWNVGSVTKTFVAVVVLQLVEEGAVDLDAGIDAWFPDLPGADRITIRQLLQHTSGLGEYKDQPAVLRDPTRRWAPSDLIAVAEAGGRAGEPGGAHHYANTNYIVLGEIVGKVTGHDWSDEVRTRIVEPLGLTHTGEMGDERPVGYQAADGAFVDTTWSSDPSIGGAAGALQSTGPDLLRFVTALADGTLLSPSSLAAMRTFVEAEDYSQFGIVHGYGLGLERYVLDGLTVEGHMGTGDAQSAYVGYDTERGTAVAVMTNTATPGPQAMMAVEALTAVRAVG